MTLMRDFWKNVVGVNKPMQLNLGGPAQGAPAQVPKAPRVLQSIKISSENPSQDPPQLVNWQEVRFMAKGAFSDGSTGDVTTKVHWSSDPDTIVVIESPGHAAAQRVAGSAVIKAEDPSNPLVNDSMTVTVTVTPVSLIDANSKATAEYQLCNKFYNEYGDAVQALAEARKKASAPKATQADVNDVDSKAAQERLSFWDLKKEVLRLEPALKDLLDALNNLPPSRSVNNLAKQALANWETYKDALLIFKRAVKQAEESHKQQNP
jgi:tetratricopeptide (TPR) repeat protein